MNRFKNLIFAVAALAACAACLYGFGGHLDRGEFWKGMPPVDQSWEFATAEDVTEFTATAITSGTNTFTAADGGTTILSGVATTDNTGYQIQHEGSPLDLAANNVASCRSRAKISTLDVEWIMGWAILDASLMASAPTDGIYLHKAEDTGVVTLRVIRDSSSVTKTIGVAAVASSYEVWGLQVRAGSTPRTCWIQVYRNGIVAHEAEYTAVPDDEILALSLAMQSGSATGTQTMTLDYLQHVSTRN